MARRKNFPVLEIGIVLLLAAVTIGFFIKRKPSTPRVSAHKVLVDPTVKYSLPLMEKIEVSHDTRRFRYKLPHPNDVLGLPIGQHINLSAKINDELVIRSYTPTSSDDDKGFMELVVKIYKKDTHPKFKEGGKMTQYLDNMKIGDTIDVRGPSGKLQYVGNGKFLIKNLRNEPPTTVHAKKINMIAGGTGITPMLQLIRHIIKTKDDKTKLALLFANQTEKDILLRDELEAAALGNPDKLKLWFTVDTANEDWAFSTGFVNSTMIQDHLYPPSADTITLMCGPPPMIKFAVTPSLDTLGYDQNMRFSF